MKRSLAVGFIATYLATLSVGIVSHMLGFGTAAHPLMYFIVWDMFCGWTAYDSRAYVVGEGESGKLYDLATPPWGEFHPWGGLGRQHYDALNNHCGRIGLNTLRHTAHEPVNRMYVLEENWAKKYNVPETVWQARYDEPRDVQKYYRVRSVILPDGTIAQATIAWLQYQALTMLADNPRLRMQSEKGRSVFVDDRIRPGRDMLIAPGTPTGLPRTTTTSSIEAPLTN